LWRWLTLDALFERPSGEAGADEGIAARQRQRAVRAAIDALPEGLRRVVTLRELAGLSYEEISRVLSLPVGTVASRRSAAIKHLEDALGTLEGGEADDLARGAL
jgi:RNA polymerase sigma-70 factor (ECF subfamily)